VPAGTSLAGAKGRLVLESGPFKIKGDPVERALADR
jgi:hypothetical protein